MTRRTALHRDRLGAASATAVVLFLGAVPAAAQDVPASVPAPADPGDVPSSGPVPAPAEDVPPGAPAPADAPGMASPWPFEWRGRASTNVVPLQLLLVNAGHDIAVDGVFGPRTEAAVRAVQRRAGVTVDGIVGPETWPLLLPPLRQGGHGPAVRALQRKLHVNGYDLAVDGVFGPVTVDRVRRLQADVRLRVDGVVGQDTWRELLWHGLND